VLLFFGNEKFHEIFHNTDGYIACSAAVSFIKLIVLQNGDQSRKISSFIIIFLYSLRKVSERRRDMA